MNRRKIREAEVQSSGAAKNYDNVLIYIESV